MLKRQTDFFLIATLVVMEMEREGNGKRIVKCCSGRGGYSGKPSCSYLGKLSGSQYIPFSQAGFISSVASMAFWKSKY